MNSPKNTRVRMSHGIAPSTLHRIVKEETKLRSEYERNASSNRLSLRTSPHMELESSLIKWIRVMRDRKIALSGPVVQEKAIEFAKLSNITDFSASSGWLTRFKVRENLDFKNVVGEGGDVDQNVVKSWTETVLPSMLKDFR